MMLHTIDYPLQHLANLKPTIRVLVFAVLCAFTLSAQANQLQLNGKALWCEGAELGLVFEGNRVCEIQLIGLEVMEHCAAYEIFSPILEWKRFERTGRSSEGALNLKTLSLEYRFTPGYFKVGEKKKSACKLSSEDLIVKTLRTKSDNETKSWAINDDNSGVSLKDPLAYAQSKAKMLLEDEEKLNMFLRMIVGFRQGIKRSGYDKPCLSDETYYSIGKRILNLILDKQKLEVEALAMTYAMKGIALLKKNVPYAVTFESFFNHLWSLHAFELMVKSCNAQRVD